MIAKRAVSRRIVVRPGNSLVRLHRDYEITRRRSRPLSESARNRKSPARFVASRRRFAASDYDPVIALTISLDSEAPHFLSPLELLARAITETCVHARTQARTRRSRNEGKIKQKKKKEEERKIKKRWMNSYAVSLSRHLDARLSYNHERIKIELAPCYRSNLLNRHRFFPITKRDAQFLQLG